MIHGVSIEVNAAEVVCLLGRNGAGKSTTLRSIMGLTPPRSGTIEFMGQEITGRQPFEIARLGIGYIPDDRRIFADLTVEENLQIVRRVTRRDGRWTLERVLRALSRCSRNCDASAVRGSRAGSRRCSRSAARSWAIPACSYWTSLRRA